MDFLTTSEAADYVRLGERKLYELVTSGAIPCSKVTGKWLFPRQELDLWVLSGLSRPAGMIAADPPPIVARVAGTSYELGPLSPGTSYVWRVDAVNPGGAVEGASWRFTTAGPGSGAGSGASSATR